MSGARRFAQKATSVLCSLVMLTSLFPTTALAAGSEGGSSSDASSSTTAEVQTSDEGATADESASTTTTSSEDTEEGANESTSAALTTESDGTVLSAQSDDTALSVQFDDTPAYSGGEGTEASPYLLSSADDLVALANAVNNDSIDYAGQYFKMTADIDLSTVCYRVGGTYTTDKSWTPIGVSKVFQGTFDGDGHYIENLYIDTDSQSAQGLFGNLGSQSTIKNFVLASGMVYAPNAHAGGIAGKTYGDSATQGAKIMNVGNEADVTGSEYVGGLVSYISQYTTVSGCYNAGHVYIAGPATGYPSVGGLAGFCGSALVDCYNTGAVTAKVTVSRVGGLVGNLIGSSSYLESCYNAGLIEGADSQYIGAIVGTLWPNQPINCYYLDTSCDSGAGYSVTTATSLTEAEIKASSFPALLDSDAFETIDDSYSALIWQGKSGRADITSQPAGAKYAAGATPAALSVSAQLPSQTNALGKDGALTYQWYENTSDSTEGGTALKDANSSTYTPDISADGTTYYYCVVTNTFGEQTRDAASDTARVYVSASGLAAVPTLSGPEDASVAPFGTAKQFLCLSRTSKIPAWATLPISGTAIRLIRMSMARRLRGRRLKRIRRMSLRFPEPHTIIAKSRTPSVRGAVRRPLLKQRPIR